jgi:D-sedoheptulose 7-phosphate isomerase
MAAFYDNILQLNDLVRNMAPLESKVEEAAHMMADCVCNGGTIYVIGNGGSAADANHFAGEILGRFKKERKGLPCVSLTADNATITAIANDYGFDFIFSRQLEGLFDPSKDILFTMSTSGNSKNILNALNYLDSIDGYSVNLIGRDGGETLSLSANSNETNIVIPAQSSDRIQEMHKFILHYFAEVIEEVYCNQ